MCSGGHGGQKALEPLEPEVAGHRVSMENWKLGEAFHSWPWSRGTGPGNGTSEGQSAQT